MFFGVNVKRHSIFCLATFLLIQFSAVSQILDTDFITNLSKEATVSSIAYDSEGKIYITGDFKQINHNPFGLDFSSNMIRLNPDKTIDESFKLSNSLSALTISEVRVEFGRIIVLASESSASDKLYVLNEDGSIDPNFNLDNEFTSINEVLYDGDFFYVLGFASNSVFARLNTDGSLDENYGLHLVEGFSSSNLVKTTDGSVLVSGNFNKYDNEATGPIFRILSDGSLDNTFNTGSSEIGQLNQIALDSNGDIYVIGFFTEFNGTSTPSHIIKLNSDGTINNDFELNIIQNVISNDISKIQIDSTDQIYLLGRDFSNGAKIRLGKFNSDGTIDNSFALPDLRQNESDIKFFNLALYQDEITFTAGFDKISEDIAYGIATYDLQGKNITNLPLLTKSAPIKTLAVQSDGKIIVGGEFLFVNSEFVPRLVRINNNGTVDNTFDVTIDLLGQINNRIESIGVQEDGKIIIGGRNLNANFQSSVFRINQDGSLDETFDSQLFNDVFEIKLLEGGNLMVSGYNLSNIQNQNLVRLKSDGTFDDTFSTEAFSQFDRVYDLEQLEDGSWIIVGQKGNSVNGFVFHLSENGALINTLDIENIPKTIEIVNDNILIGGVNTSGGSFLENPTFVIQLNESLEVVDQNSIGITARTNFGFYEDFYSTMNDEFIIGGFFDFINSTEQQGLARIKTNGVLDRDFVFNLNGWAEEIIKYDEDHIIVGGPYVSINGTAQFSLSKIRITNTPPTSTGLSSAKTIQEDTSLELTKSDFNIVDPDDEFEDQILTLISGDLYSIDGNTLTPNQDYFGTLTVTAKLNDGKEDGPDFTFDITVEPVNDNPLIANYTGEDTFNEDTSLTLDKDDFDLSDVDNTIEELSLVILEGTNYTSDNNSIIPNENFFGELEVGVAAYDGDLNSETLFLTFDVSPINDAPSVSGLIDALTILEDNTQEISKELFNIIDPDNSIDELTFTLSEGNNFTLDGSLVVPDQDYFGTLEMSIVLNDGMESSEPFNFAIEVTPVNDSPIVTSYSGVADIDEDTSFELKLSDFEVTDIDNESNALSLVILDGPNYTFDAFNVTPDEDFDESLVVNIAVSDGNDQSEIFEIEINISPINDAPIILGTVENLMTDSETPFTITLDLLEVDDPDNEYPNDFTLRIEEGTDYVLNGNIVSTSEEFVGTLQIPVIVNDGELSSESFTLNLEVSEVTSLNKEEISGILLAYPNPAMDHVFVSINNNSYDAINISIINAKGELITAGNFNKLHQEFETKLDISDQSNGIYLIVIRQGYNFLSSKRIVKQ